MNEDFIKELYKKYELKDIFNNSSGNSTLYLLNHLIEIASIKFDVVIDKQIENADFVEVKKENNIVKINYKADITKHKIQNLSILIKKDIELDLFIDANISVLIFSHGLKNLNLTLKKGTIDLALFNFYGSLNTKLNALQNSTISFNFIPASNIDSKFKIIGNAKENSHIYINEIAVLNNAQRIDFETLAFLEGSQSIVDINSRALLYGNSLCIFKGYVESGENSKGSISSLSQGSMLFSKHAHADLIPIMAIKTNDLKASHESYIIPINNEILFFASTRGIKENTFKKLAAHAFIEALIEKINNEKAKEIMFKIINDKIEEGVVYDA
ncbi:MAG: SufD family Fe-S cluster assembly protein [Candidatus Micrarchaeia archaeon]